MTEPTDAELDMLIDDVAGLDSSNEAFRNFARAVLARWGHPAHSGEPVAWLHDCAALLTNDVELWINACPHCGKPRTTPQPTQPQAVAVPLTDEKAQELIELESWGPDATSLNAQLLRTIRRTEAEHGIKGGQHGTE